MGLLKRPTRIVLALAVLILLSLGLAAYFVNLPLSWIAAGEALAMLGLAWRLSQRKQPQPVADSATDSRPKS